MSTVAFCSYNLSCGEGEKERDLNNVQLDIRVKRKELDSLFVCKVYLHHSSDGLTSSKK